MTKKTPFPYQAEGTSWLAGKNAALLADEMGLGKTLQVVNALDEIKAKKVLVVGPAVAKDVWLQEFEDEAVTPRRYQIMQKLAEMPHKTTDVVICSYDYATANHAHLSKTKWDALILDEFHFLKSTNAKRASNILGRHGIIRSTSRMWAITGTPAPNHAGELWILLYTWGLTPLKYEAFLKRFCDTRQTGYGLKVTGTNLLMIPKLRELLSSIMLRRLKKDVMKNLPPIVYSHLRISPGIVDLPMQASFTHYYVPVDDSKALIKRLHDEAKLANDVLNNMRCNNPDALQAVASIQDSVSALRRYIGLQKVQPVADIVIAAFKHGPAEFKKLVIFAIHRDVIEGLRDILSKAKLGPVTIYGGTDPDRRRRNIKRFNERPSCKVMIANIHAAGTAINLTVAHNVYFIEQDWVPGNNAQAVMRCHRIGQENKVLVKFFSLRDSIDNRIMLLVKKKTRELTKIFD